MNVFHWTWIQMFELSSPSQIFSDIEIMWMKINMTSNKIRFSLITMIFVYTLLQWKCHSDLWSWCTLKPFCISKIQISHDISPIWGRYRGNKSNIFISICLVQSQMCLVWCQTDCFISDLKDTWDFTLLWNTSCRLAWQTDVYWIGLSDVCDIRFQQSICQMCTVCHVASRISAAVKHSLSILAILITAALPVIPVGCQDLGACLCLLSTIWGSA